MSFVSVAPDVVTAASGNLESIGSALRAANAAAAVQTTAIAAPAADEVSAAITSCFGTAAQEYQALSAQAAAFHDDFVGALNAAIRQYANAEAANAQKAVANAVSTPAQAVSEAAAAATSAATETINSPFGPISLSVGGSFPTGTGPFSGWGTASTPIGGAAGTVQGQIATLGSGYQVTVGGASLTWPGLISFVTAATGPFVSGDLSLANSFNTLLADLSHGNVLGAAAALVTAPGNFGYAVTFGHNTLTIPINTGAIGGPVVDLGVPFGGLFASSQPVTASWPTFSVTGTNGSTYTVHGESNFALGGSKVGGPLAYLLNAVGVHY